MKKKAKSAPHKRICWVGWGKVVFRKKKKKIYEDENQTGNFIGVKIENGLYYMGEKHY